MADDYDFQYSDDEMGVDPADFEGSGGEMHDEGIDVAALQRHDLSPDAGDVMIDMSARKRARSTGPSPPAMRPSMGTSSSGATESPITYSRGTDTWRSMPYTRCESAMATEAAEFMEQTQLTEDEAYLMLSAFKWQGSTLLERWFDFPHRVRASSGCTAPRSAGDAARALAAHGLQSCTHVTCPITLGECASADVEALPCLHWASKEGWTALLSAAMSSANMIASCKCPEAGCSERIPRSFFMDYLPRELVPRFLEFLARHFVECNPKYKWCPSPACDQVVRTDGGAVDVHCAHKHDFCFGCSFLGSHRPALCSEVKHWAELQGDAAHEAFVLKLTKGCPKCNVRMERSSGCNKVTCTQCRTAFCWNCLRFPFETAHNYPAEAWHCNVPAPDTSTTDNLAYLLAFCAEHAATHAQSAALMDASGMERATVTSAVQSLLGLAATDVQHLLDAADIIRAARLVCRWSYVRAYHLATLLRDVSVPQAAAAAEKEKKAAAAGKVGTGAKRAAGAPAPAGTTAPFTPARSDDFLAGARTEYNLFVDAQGRLEGYVEMLANMLDTKEMMTKYVLPFVPDVVLAVDKAGVDSTTYVSPLADLVTKRTRELTLKAEQEDQAALLEAARNRRPGSAKAKGSSHKAAASASASSSSSVSAAAGVSTPDVMRLCRWQAGQAPCPLTEEELIAARTAVTPSLTEDVMNKWHAERMKCNNFIAATNKFMRALIEGVDASMIATL